MTTIDPKTLPPGYKRARKSPERRLGFIAGDWIIVPLVTTGFAAGYVSESGKSFLLVHWINQRFVAPPTYSELEQFGLDAYGIPVRFKPSDFGHSSVWRLTPGKFSTIQFPRPLTFYHAFSDHQSTFSMHDFPEASLEWEAIKRCTSSPDAGAGLKSSGPLSVLCSDLDRELPGRPGRIPEGIWVSMPLTKTRWGVAFVLANGDRGVCLIALHTGVIREQLTADHVRSCLETGDYRLIRTWDDQYFEGIWTEIPDTDSIVDARLNTDRLPEYVEIDDVRFKVAEPDKVDIEATKRNTANIPFEAPDFFMSWWIWRQSIVEEGPKGNLEQLVEHDLPLPAPEPDTPKPKKRRLVGQEGDWFSFPLRSGGFGVARITRVIDDALFTYFMDARSSEPPTISQVEHLRPADVVHMELADSWEFRNASAQKLGQGSTWRREEWPMPSLFRRHFMIATDVIDQPDPEPGIPLDDNGVELWTPEQVHTWMIRGEPQHVSHPIFRHVDSLIEPLAKHRANWDENYLPRELNERYRLENLRNEASEARVGDWFANSLYYEGGWVIGRVVHVVGRLVLAWYFPPRLPEPVLPVGSEPKPEDRIAVRVLDFKLWTDARVILRNEPLWPGVEVDPPFSAGVSWGVPHKLRGWKTTFSLEDLNTVTSVERCSVEEALAFRGSLWMNPSMGVDNALTRMETGREVSRFRRLEGS